VSAAPANAGATGPVGLCVAVSTVGRRLDRFEQLLRSLAEQDDPDFVTGICDQSGDSRVPDLVRAYSDRLRTFSTTSAAGLSAGRNSVWRAAPPSVTHIAFPNDTTVLPRRYVSAIKALGAQADVVTCAYLQDGRPRYELPHGASDLDRFTVWKVLEPATTVATAVLADAGGFDERLGTGSRSRFQSGEGTDLLLRVMAARPVRVRWAPEVELDGVPEAFGLAPAAVRSKARSYGRGYGFVLARHRYPMRFTLPHLVGPLVKSVASGGRRIGLGTALASSVGRIEGFAGHRRHEWLTGAA
jgi:hypothetical protein